MRQIESYSFIYEGRDTEQVLVLLNWRIYAVGVLVIQVTEHPHICSNVRDMVFSEKQQEFNTKIGYMLFLMLPPGAVCSSYTIR